MNEPTCPRCKALGYVDKNCHQCEGGGETCQRCRGMGYLSGESGLMPCPCGLAYRRQVRQFADLSALRGHLLQCSFDNFRLDGSAAKTQEVYDAVLAWAKEPVGFLFVWSSRKGNGKTHLAAAAANHLMRAGKPVLFVNAPELMDWLRQAYNDEWLEDVVRRTERVKTAPILVLDDLGAEKRSDWTDERSYLIVNYRLETGLPMLVTTNQPLHKIEERVVSRLLNRGAVVIENEAQEYKAR